MTIDNICFDYTKSNVLITLKFRNSEAYDKFAGLILFIDINARIINHAFNMMMIDSGLLDFILLTETLPKGTRIIRN